MQQLKNKASEETKHTKKDVREMYEAVNVAMWDVSNAKTFHLNAEMCY